jgi:hypothetical protein
MMTERSKYMAKITRKTSLAARPKAEKVEVAVKQKPVEIPIAWVFPDDLRTTFANNLLVSFDGEEFHLSFFEVPPPIILGTPEQQQQQIKALSHIRGKCVAKIVVSKGRMVRMADVLKTAVEKHAGTSKPKAE